MLLRNKDDGCVYLVTTEYSDDNFAIYAELRERSTVHPKAKYARNFEWEYDTLAEFLDSWEDEA